MVKKAKSVKRALSAADRRKYEDLREALEAERDEIVGEARRRKGVHDTVTAELREALRLLFLVPQKVLDSATNLVDGLTPIARDAIAGLTTEYDHVWHW